MVPNYLIKSCRVCEEFESNTKYSSFGGGYFINVRNTHVCYMEFDFVRILHKVCDIGTKYMTYWYQFSTCCEELVPILHSVKFTKYEICGSTELVALLELFSCYRVAIRPEFFY